MSKPIFTAIGSSAILSNHWRRRIADLERERDSLRETVAAERAAHEATKAELKKALTWSNCDVCGGCGTPTSGRPCICDGTGKAAVAKIKIHELLLREQDASRVDRELIAELVEALAEVKAAIVKAGGLNGREYDLLGLRVNSVIERATRARTQREEAKP